MGQFDYAPVAELDEDVVALGFATRLMLTEFDRAVMIERGLEGAADLGRSERVGLFLLDPDHPELLRAEAAYCRGLISRPTVALGHAYTPAGQAILSKCAAVHGLTLLKGLPWPAPLSPGGLRCLALPLVSADNEVLGLVTMAGPADAGLATWAGQPLRVFVSIMAVALQTAQFFDLAVKDDLTGLYLRRHFDLRLAEEETRVRRYGGEVSLLFMDLDHFKEINDRHGHQAGDEALCHFARLLEGSVRRELDVICRIGGEEFAVIMPSTALAGARAVAERIRHGCAAQPLASPEGPCRLTVSCGIAHLGGPGSGCVKRAELVRRADAALYAAKEQGRDQVRVWEDEVGEADKGT